MKEKSVFKNVLYNIIRVSLSVIFPLITFPYVSRVLTAENLGKVNYALSIENYFSLIAMLGINTYAVREGARKRSNKEDFNTFANEIFTVNVITTIFSYFLMFITIGVTKELHSYAALIGLQSISIILNTIGVDWVNSVFEDYFYITVRSFIIQLILLVLMFLLVKKPNDYYIYAMLTVLSNGLCCILNYFYSRRYVKIQLVKNCQFVNHLKKIIIFFANSLAVNLYLNADTTMLGYMAGDYTVGIYSVTAKIYNVVKAVIAGMFTACIPRLSLYYGNNDIKEYKKLVNNVINICTLFMFPTVTGLIILAKPIVLILSGESYIESVSSLSIISFGIIGAIYGGITTNCINLPAKREKYNLIATILAAVINIVLNLGFIPFWKENGAAITTVIAEFIVLIYCIATNKEFWNIVEIKKLVPNIVISLFESLLIIISAILLNLFISNIYVYTCLLVLLNGLAYIAILTIFHNQVFTDFIFKVRVRSNKR